MLTLSTIALSALAASTGLTSSAAAVPSTESPGPVTTWDVTGFTAVHTFTQDATHHADCSVRLTVQNGYAVGAGKLPKTTCSWFTPCEAELFVGGYLEGGYAPCGSSGANIGWKLGKNGDGSYTLGLRHGVYEGEHKFPAGQVRKVRNYENPKDKTLYDDIDGPSSFLVPYHS